MYINKVNNEGVLVHSLMMFVECLPSGKVILGTNHKPMPELLQSETATHHYNLNACTTSKRWLPRKARHPATRELGRRQHFRGYTHWLYTPRHWTGPTFLYIEHFAATPHKKGFPNDNQSSYFFFFANDFMKTWRRGGTGQCISEDTAGRRFQNRCYCCGIYLTMPPWNDWKQIVAIWFGWSRPYKHTIYSERVV